LADSGADEHFIGSNDVALAENTHAIEPVAVGTGSGTTTVAEAGDLPGSAGLVRDAPILPASVETLCSTGKVCETLGCGYTQDPGNTAARFWHPDHPADDIELEPDGRLFRLLLEAEPPCWALSESCCCVAIPEHSLPGSACVSMAFGAVIVPSWYREHALRGHPYRSDCDHCVRGQLREKQARRKKGKRSYKGGYSMSGDFTGRHTPDLDGHTVALVCCVSGFTDEPDADAEAAFGFVRLLVSRDTDSVAQALDEFDAELSRLGKDKARAIVRFHTDIDKSFLGKVKKLALRKGWKQTDTGGYRSQANALVERRIGMLKQKARTLLLAATGGIFYCEQLWGHVLMQANHCLNRVDWKSRKSPFFQLTGEDYSWNTQDHVFGELCTWGVPKERRLGEYQPPGEVGIWVRRDDTSVGSAVVVPISWQQSTKLWVLHPTVVANTVKVHSGVYQLAMCPGEDPTDFTDFVDATFDTLLNAAAFQESAEGERARSVGVEEIEGGA